MGATTTTTTTTTSSPSSYIITAHDVADPPATWRNEHKKRIILSKQLCEAPRNIAWERRRRQFSDRQKIHLTDDDLKELKGCIELGFGFNQTNGHQLCTTIPALDLYFEVTRRKLSSSSSSCTTTPVSSAPSPKIPSPGPHNKQPHHDHAPLGSPLITDSKESKWKIFSPGDDPQQVKTKLRHWAQAVACSVMQSPSTENESEMER